MSRYVTWSAYYVISSLSCHILRHDMMWSCHDMWHDLRIMWSHHHHDTCRDMIWCDHVTICDMICVLCDLIIIVSHIVTWYDVIMSRYVTWSARHPNEWVTHRSIGDMLCASPVRTRRSNGSRTNMWHVLTYEWFMSHIHTYECVTHVGSVTYSVSTLVLQHNATHCNTLQHTVAHCNTL